MSGWPKELELDVPSKPSSDIPAGERYTLPDSGILEAEGFDPRTFESSDPKLDAFILMLAQIYNDSKAIHWFAVQLQRAAYNRTDSPVDAYLGQIRGYETWTRKQLVALLHELLQLVKDKESRRVIDSDRFVTFMNRLPLSTQQRWWAVFNVATRAKKGTFPGELANYFERVRGNLAFHYYQPKSLLNGYKHHFRQGQDAPDDPVRQRAYASLGDRLETTRFFFADAAAQAYMQDIVDPGARIWNDTVTLVGEVNTLLFAVVREYLHMRAEELLAEVART